MPYLNLDLDYNSHPKTVRLIGLLGKEAEILPVRLWCRVGKFHSTTGILSDYSPQEIEASVNWWGVPGKMVEAMLKTGHLRKVNNGYEVVDFLEHNGHLAMFKERARKAARARWGINEDATSNRQAINKQCPNRTNQTKPTNKSAFSFETVWSQYPKKVGKRDAERHFNALIKTKEDFKAIQAALENYKQSARVQKGYLWDGGRWFLNWRDWIELPANEVFCQQCKNTGKYTSSTGYECVCTCPAGKRQ